MKDISNALVRINKVACWILFWGTVVIAGSYVYKWTHTEPVSVSPYISRIDILGEISPGLTDKLIPQLEIAYSDPKSKMVMLNIDSGGGSGYEAWRLCDYLQGKMKEEAGKSERERRPTVSVIAMNGTSAAFHIALCTEKVYAAPYSQIGSVGIIFYYKESDAKEYQNIASGEGKAFNFITPESRLVAKEIVTDGAEFFLKEVVALRGNRLKIDLKDLASGRMWSGQKGLKLGLVDAFATPESIARQMKLPLFWPGIQEPTVWDKAKDVLSVLRQYPVQVPKP
jgi:protease-4